MDVPLGGKILVNDTPAMPGTRVYENFTLDWDIHGEPAYEELAEENYEEAPKAGSGEEGRDGQGKAAEMLTGEDGTMPGTKSLEEKEPGNGSKTTEGDVTLPVTVNGQTVLLTGKNSYIFVDVFSFIAFDLNDPAGRDIVTQLNGRQAGYMESLKSGDVIEIYWKNRNEKM